MNILFLGYYADAYHGSVKHILDYSRYLTSIGHKVSFGALYISEELRDLFRESNADLLQIDDVPLNEEYDVVWTFHNLVLPIMLGKG